MTSVVVAQTAPTLSGRVVEQATGRPIADAEVIIEDSDAARQVTRSDARGFYQLAPGASGLYDVRVAAPGFQPALQPRFRVAEGRATTLDFELLRQSSPDDLAEIVVTTRARSADPLASVSAQRLDREEIRRSPGTAGDVFRGLDILPGVASTGEFSQFAVRGNGQRDNLILIDGIPFDKVVHFAQSLGDPDDIGGGGRFSIFAPDIIAAAEFQPGNWRAAEAGRLGSLLALELSGGSTTDAVVRAQLDVAGGELAYEGPTGLPGNSSLLLSARALDFERLFKAIDNEDIGVPSLTDLTAKAVFRPDDAHRLELLAIRSSDDYRRDVSHVLASENFQDVSLTDARQDSSLLGFTWKWLPRERAQLRNIVYLRDSDKDTTQGEAFPDLAPPGAGAAQIPVRDRILTLAEREREYGWRLDFTDTLASGAGYSLGAQLRRIEAEFDTRLAGDWIRFEYDQDDFRPSPAQQYLLLTPARIDATVRTAATDAALYADYTIRAGAWSITPGLRGDHQGLTRDTTWSPRLSVNWQARPHWRWWAGAGAYRQAPNLLTVGADTRNTRLGSERANQVALGTQYSFNRDWRLSGEVYHQQLDDLIVIADRNDGRAVNRGTGRNSGFELSLSKRSGATWWGSASYAWSRAGRDDGAGSGAYDADQHRPHVFTVFGAWEPNARWAFAAKWKYASGRPRDPYVVRANVLAPTGPLRFSREYLANNTGRFPAFHALNLRADYRRRLGAVDLIAFLDVVNVYGRAIVDEAEWDERRGVEITDGLEIFPTIGVRFEYAF